jgi:hypothetical protein
VGTRQDITEALLAGAQAAQNGDEPTTCPYPRDSLLRRAWIRGYARARPVADTTAETE